MDKESRMKTQFTFAKLVSRAILTGQLCLKIGVRPGILLGMSLRKRNPREYVRFVPVKVHGFPHPIYLRAGTSDTPTFCQALMHREYDIRSFPQFQKLNNLYQKSKAQGHRPLIIDCGANIGLSAVWFSHLFPEAQIFAVEPDADNFKVAQRNLAAYPNVTLLRGAIWDCPKDLAIFRYDRRSLGLPDGGSAERSRQKPGQDIEGVYDFRNHGHGGYASGIDRQGGYRRRGSIAFSLEY